VEAEGPDWNAASNFIQQQAKITLSIRQMPLAYLCFRLLPVPHALSVQLASGFPVRYCFPSEVEDTFFIRSGAEQNQFHNSQILSSFEMQMPTFETLGRLPSAKTIQNQQVAQLPNFFATVSSQQARVGLPHRRENFYRFENAARDPLTAANKRGEQTEKQ
jgi:hypothetical protein